MKFPSITLHAKPCFLSALLMLWAVTGRSQHNIGIATSQWSAINSLHLNPASIAACREKMSIGICSVNMAVDNDLGQLPVRSNIATTANGNNNIFTRAKKTSFNMIVPAASVRAPGIVVAVTDKISVAFASAIRGFSQFTNFDPSLYNTLTAPIATDATYSVKMHNFNWTAHMWSETGLSIGGVVREGDHSSLSLGATFRRLAGIGYVAIRGVNMDANFNAGTDVVNATNSNIDFGSNVPNDSSLIFKRMTPEGLFSNFFKDPPGIGMAADLGFTVTCRIGEAESSTYMESDLTHNLVFSAAVTDWGAIKYFNGSSVAVKISGDGNITGKDLSKNAHDAASMLAYAKKQGFAVDSLINSRRVHLPTALITGADVQVYGRFYVNLLYIHNLANRFEFGNSYYNQFTITPRYDYHKMTISVPITYSALSARYKMGVAFRYTGFFIGSDDILALINKYQYGLGFYMGGYVPVFRKKYDPSGLHWRN